MEGISGMVMYTGIGLGILLVIWLIFKFRKPAEIALELLDPVAEISKSVAKILIKDEKKETEAVKYIDILQASVRSVNRKKEEIKAKLGDNATAEARHKAYREAALEIANEIAKENGINPDVMSKTIASTAIDMILDLLPKEEVTHVDLKEAQTH